MKIKDDEKIKKYLYQVSVFYTHDYINHDTNTGVLCRFWYERVYFFLLSALGDKRRETQCKLCKPHDETSHTFGASCWAKDFNSSPPVATQTDKIWSDQKKLNCPLVRLYLNSSFFFWFFFFNIPKLSGHHFRAWYHLPIQSTPTVSPISCLGVCYEIWCISYPLRAGLRVHCMTTMLKPCDNEKSKDLLNSIIKYNYQKLMYISNHYLNYITSEQNKNINKKQQK